jgi:serine/threonine protein kinase
VQSRRWGGTKTSEFAFRPILSSNGLLRFVELALLMTEQATDGAHDRENSGKIHAHDDFSLTVHKLRVGMKLASGLYTIVNPTFRQGTYGQILLCQKNQKEADGKKGLFVVKLPLRGNKPAIAEVHALLSLGNRHPNIVTIDWTEVDRGLPLIALAFAGQAWYRVLRGHSCKSSTGKLDRSAGAWLRQMLCVALQCFDALDHVHTHGFLWGDASTNNILLADSSDGFVAKLTDFGNARPLVKSHGSDGTSMAENRLGTPPYQSPEQEKRREFIGVGSDVWGLAACFSHSLRGYCKKKDCSLATFSEQSTCHGCASVSECFVRAPSAGDDSDFHARAALESLFERCFADSEQKRPLAREVRDTLTALHCTLKSSTRNMYGSTTPPSAEMQALFLGIERQLQRDPDAEARYEEFETECFPSIVKRAHDHMSSTNGTYDLTYDRAPTFKEENVLRHRIRRKGEKPRTTLSEGEVVDVRHGGGKKLFPGKIAKVHDDGSYDIMYDDGDKESKVARKLIEAECGDSSGGSDGGMGRGKGTENEAKKMVAEKADQEEGGGSADAQLKEGDAVEARHGGQAQWFPGKVKISAVHAATTWGMLTECYHSFSALHMFHLQKRKFESADALYGKVEACVALGVRTRNSGTRACDALRCLCQSACVDNYRNFLVAQGAFLPRMQDAAAAKFGAEAMVVDRQFIKIIREMKALDGSNGFFVLRETARLHCKWHLRLYDGMPFFALLSTFYERGGIDRLQPPDGSAASYPHLPSVRSLELEIEKTWNWLEEEKVWAWRRQRRLKGESRAHASQFNALFQWLRQRTHREALNCAEALYQLFATALEEANGGARG